MKMMITVYMHTNVLTGKSYIGYTKHTLEKRWAGHVYDAFKGDHLYFHKAIRKYGANCWIHSVLEICETSAEAKCVEKSLIREFETRTTGYNTTDGGEGVIGYVWTDEARKTLSLSHRGLNRSKEHCKHLSDALKGRKRSAEHQSKITLARRGLLLSDETKQKMSESRRGSKNPNFGKPLSDDVKRKISIAKHGKKLTSEHKSKISDSLRAKHHNNDMRDEG